MPTPSETVRSNMIKEIYGRGLTVNDLVANCNLQRRTVTMFMKEKHKRVSINTLVEIGKALDIPFYAFVSEKLLLKHRVYMLLSKMERLPEKEQKDIFESLLRILSPRLPFVFNKNIPENYKGAVTARGSVLKTWEEK